MPDLVKAKKLITEAADQCLLAAQLADRHAAYEKRRDGEVAQQQALLDAEHAAVKHRLPAVTEAKRLAEEQAAKQDYVAAQAALDAALLAIADAAALKKTSEDFNARLLLVEPDVTGLTNASPRAGAPNIGADVAKVDAALAEAKAKALLFDFKAADTALASAKAQCKSVEVKKLLKAPSPDPVVLKNQMEALNKQPGGQQLLDALIAGLSPTDSPDHVLAALAVRFNLKQGAQDEGTGAQKSTVAVLKRVYKLMAEVPDKHTKENPRMRQITRKPAGGSSYGGGNVVLGDALNEGSKRQLVLPGELPGVDDKCKPPTGKEAPVFFDWNVQHEIAHALDDKKKFMASNENVDKYGAWVNHGGNVSAVAKAAADALNLEGIDQAAIAKYLDGGTVPSPVPTDWATMTAWADAIRHGQIPWKAGAKCTQAIKDGGFIIGDRIYHEAYANRWVSYKATARAEGITGYQFRAPGEWFSELYAAYKSEQMKPAHPAKEWLDNLFGV